MFERVADNNRLAVVEAGTPAADLDFESSSRTHLGEPLRSPSSSAQRPRRVLPIVGVAQRRPSPPPSTLAASGISGGEMRQIFVVPRIPRTIVLALIIAIATRPVKSTVYVESGCFLACKRDKFDSWPICAIPNACQIPSCHLCTPNRLESSHTPRYFPLPLQHPRQMPTDRRRNLLGGLVIEHHFNERPRR